MSNYKNAKEYLKEFLKDDENNVAILEGTNYNNKHSLALDVALEELSEGGRILFRSSAVRNIERDLAEALDASEEEIKEIKRKRSMVRGNVVIYADTISEKSQTETPQHIDIAIIYPFEACGKVQVAENTLEDLQKRSKKTICCTWVDNVRWVDEIPGKRITYHIKEEIPSFHDEALSGKNHKKEEEYK